MSDSKTESGKWTWWSTATATMEEKHHDVIQVFVQSQSVILYANRHPSNPDHVGIVRMTTQDMREFGELLIEGADTLEAKLTTE